MPDGKVIEGNAFDQPKVGSLLPGHAGDVSSKHDEDVPVKLSIRFVT